MARRPRPDAGDAVPGLEYTDVAAAVEALREAGFPLVDDHNRPGAVGAGRMPMSSRDGVRVTTADAYLATGLDPAEPSRPG